MTVPGDQPVRVLLADDHAAIRAGLRMLLDAADGVEVVAEAADGDAAITNARAVRPDVVLMDLRMPGTDGVAATRAITAEGLADVLVLTTFDLDEYVHGALDAGAAGFLLKSAEPAEKPAENLGEEIRKNLPGRLFPRRDDPKKSPDQHPGRDR